MPLIFSRPTDPGIRRLRNGDAFVYRAPGGKPVAARALKRIEALKLPPAWEDVWICASPHGHLQSVGRDARGRLQYRYHDSYRADRESAKYTRILRFARILPLIRRRIAADMARRGLPREKVVATVAHLLETTMIRIGNRQYAETNGTFGLSTLRDRHVHADGETLVFRFRGKSGKDWRIQVRDRRAARIVKACQDLPGQHLFQYVDADGQRREIASDDVNAYLREVSGVRITAKDFRTWGATVLCALSLMDAPPETDVRRVRRQIAQAVKAVAGTLGNTPAICRSSYIHPGIISTHAQGELGRRLQIGMRRALERARDADGLKPEESAVLSLLTQLARRKPVAATVAGREDGPAVRRAVRAMQESMAA